MRLTISVDSWAARLLLALAVTPIASCSTAGEPTASRTVCEKPQPVLTPGDAGYELCSSGVIHRRAALECPAPTVFQACMTGVGGSGSGSGAGGSGAGGSGGAGGGAGAVPTQCTTDADCKAQPHGTCQGLVPDCGCSYSCRTDAECGPDRSCVCGEYQSTCKVAGCASDADCGGFLCAVELVVDGRGCATIQVLQCLTAEDTCITNADCEVGTMCVRSNGHLSCSGSSVSEPRCCASCGRPFLVDGAHRQAPEASRGDWMAAGQEPCLEGLAADEREALAAHWTSVGLMEHASIAAFARFSLQLLAVGAPPELLRDAQAAMADETEHTRLCFALASAYAGRSIGPGRLSLSGALDAQDDRAILITTIREGCIGETLAAIEAAEASAHATDPAVRAVLTQIAADEERHALLAWRYVAWAIGNGGEAMAVIAAAELEAVFAEPIAVGESNDALLVHGVTGDARGAEIRRQAIARVIRPAARGVLARA